jgi:hypothetical protein
MATGCYINGEAMCAWFWVDTDQCPDEIPGDQDEIPILAAHGAPEGLYDTSNQSCGLKVRMNLWMIEEQECYLMSASTWYAHYPGASGAECP